MDAAAPASAAGGDAGTAASSVGRTAASARFAAAAAFHPSARRYAGQLFALARKNVILLSRARSATLVCWRACVFG